MRALLEHDAAILMADKICDYIAKHGDADVGADDLGQRVSGLELLFDPKLADLGIDMHRQVMSYWRELPQVDGVPNQTKVDPTKLLSSLGYLMLVDVGERKGDFVYALYGSNIARTAGFDMTGKSVWDVGTTSPIKVLFAACYETVKRLRKPLLTVHEAAPEVTISHWHRLILPLGQDGNVTRFLVCNVPIHQGTIR